MNDFFKFDDNRLFFILSLLINIIIAFLSIFILIKYSILISLYPLILLIVLIPISIYTYNEGIHFNYKKGKIIIVYYLTIKIIDMKDVKYFSLIRINKKRKKGLIQKIIDPYKAVDTPPKYVYNNGEVYNIVFYMNKFSNISIYYGRLYKTRSKERVNKQNECFNDIKMRFSKYKGYCK